MALTDHFDLTINLNYFEMCSNNCMSSQYKFENHSQDLDHQSRVKLTDLLSRINEEKKIERNRNFVLGVAAFSAATVFGIILTL